MLTEQEKEKYSLIKSKMIYRRLGNTGLFVSVLGLGSWLTVDNDVEDRATSTIEAALAAGINFFDTADVYSNGRAEIVLGHAFKKLNVRRSDIVVMTKSFFGCTDENGAKRVNAAGLSRKALIEGLDASLERLQLEYVDVFKCHRCDIYTPIEEVVDTMNLLIKRGKIFYWGTSGWTAEEIRIAKNYAEKFGLSGPVADQAEYSLLRRGILESDYLRLFKETNYGTTVYGTLAGGWIAGRYNDASQDALPQDSRFASKAAAPFVQTYFTTYGTFPQVQAKTREFAALAQSLGVAPSTLSFAWVLQNTNVSSALIGVTKNSQLEENLTCLQHLDLLTPEVLEKIDAIFPKPASIAVNNRDAFGRPVF